MAVDPPDGVEEAWLSRGAAAVPGCDLLSASPASKHITLSLACLHQVGAGTARAGAGPCPHSESEKAELGPLHPCLTDPPGDLPGCSILVALL